MPQEQAKQALLEGEFGPIGTDVLTVPLAALVMAWEHLADESATDARWRLHRLARELDDGPGFEFIELGLEGSSGYLVRLDEVLARAGARLRFVEAAFRGPPPGIRLPEGHGELGFDLPIVGFVHPDEAADAAARVLALDDIANNELYAALILSASESLTMLLVSSADAAPEDAEQS